MDRIAAISDIHGNIPALEAVLEDIESRKIKTIICLGDLIGKGPDSALAVDRIQNTCEKVIQGNWDDFISNPTDSETGRWHQQQLGSERLSYLNSLPFHHDFVMSGKRIRLVHASAKSVHHRVVPFHPLEERLAMFESTERTGQFPDNGLPDVVGYGDIHAVYLEHLEKKTLLNVGSVGNPLDIPQAAYAIFEGFLETREPAPFSIQFVRVPYDIEKAITRARDAKMPELEPYIKELRTAEYRGKG